MSSISHSQTQSVISGPIETEWISCCVERSEHSGTRCGVNDPGVVHLGCGGSGAARLVSSDAVPGADRGGIDFPAVSARTRGTAVDVPSDPVSPFPRGTTSTARKASPRWRGGGGTFQDPVREARPPEITVEMPVLLFPRRRGPPRSELLPAARKRSFHTEQSE
ncbi:hypothetical protein AAFF_G00278650 [Aldrovandia affinis]|uniref:Uncharacterized protein n=1 Tax=Aldrovandia affinis TaxID=143900 RepID=A0AAD7WS10_9TELE|nr:hypothetical protein AAFF_G00278650 [Aldrovandia affinis]